MRAYVQNELICTWKVHGIEYAFNSAIVRASKKLLTRVKVLCSIRGYKPIGYCKHAQSKIAQPNLQVKTNILQVPILQIDIYTVCKELITN